MTHKNLAFSLALALTLGGCGYFNSFYNARRQFSDAERARTRGEIETARTGYSGSIEKAAKSYRKYPRGRWADDALYLIGRAHFQLGDYAAARAAFAELLTNTRDDGVRAGAHAYAGATDFRLASLEVALAHLDSAVALTDDESAQGFARLWRSRARAAIGDIAGAWVDLDAVTSPDDREYATVQIERVALATQGRDTARLASAFAGLLGGRDVRQQLDTLNALATSAAAWFGADTVRAMLAVPHAMWTPSARDSLSLIRAQIAARAGDTLNAHHELMDLATHAATPTAAMARVTLARSRLAAVDRMEELGEIRALLLPAITMAEAQILIRTIRMVDVMVRRSAETGQPLALFGAAEIARDELAAPRLARKLFSAFADVGAQTPWAAKALLAGIALDAAGEEANALRDRLHALPPNPYSSATRGEIVDDAYESAEERLARSMQALKTEATVLAQRQETAVSRAIAVLDSITAAARADTVLAACGVMLDTLAITGIRADSVRTACVRRDTVNLALYLTADTLAWRPATPGDSIRRRIRRPGTTTSTIRDSIK
jgi:tetratricopeptide (TPR) repeat protein